VKEYERGFPLELLKRPRDERIAYFRGYTIAHPRLQQTHNAVMQAIREPGGAPLILIVGPTGVGKTTLRQRAEKVLIEQMLSSLDDDRGRIPVASVQAIAPNSGNFNWKEYCTRALEALSEPLIDHKVDVDHLAARASSTIHFPARKQVAGAEVLRALEHALRYRHPAAFFVDDAQHMAKMASGRKLQDQLDCIKSLVDQTNIPHVLLGTYELLVFRNLSAQLSRRSTDIHFPRYRIEQAEDMQSFRRVILNFQRRMPLTTEPDLVSSWELCYERSIGCIGVLKDWFTRTLAAAIDMDEPLTVSHLEDHALSMSQCERMARDAVEGERQLAETAGDRSTLRSLLGMDPTLNAPRDASNGQRKAKVPRRVGERNPTRDVVGNKHAV
jgi:AAA domain